jgi:hypothetical protein
VRTKAASQHRLIYVMMVFALANEGWGFFFHQ